MKKVSISILIFLFLAGGAYIVFFKKDKDVRTGVERAQVVDIKSAKKGVVSETGGEKTYRSEGFGFSFQFPKDFTLGEFDEAGGRMVLINTGTSSIQIFITDYNESGGVLTFEKISADVPGLKINEPETFSLTGGEVALVFVGEDATFGNTREIWMVHKGHLFQIITPIESQETLATLLNTWELF